MTIKDCPRCGGTHYGSVVCPTQDDALFNREADGVTLKSMPHPVPEDLRPHTLEDIEIEVPFKYERLLVACNLSFCALQQAAMLLESSHIYHLYVATNSAVWARSLLHRLSADVKENPLAPHINLHTNPEFRAEEWALFSNGVGVGSEGV